MQYISSDTNVWIDFSAIQRIPLPFRLSYTYIMHRDAIEVEIQTPEGIGEELIRCGLVPVDISIEEFLLADEYGQRYKRLTIFDRIALSIAKKRGYILLTGDRMLRRAAEEESVPVLGTLGILDQLFEQHLIDAEEYRYCLTKLQQLNGAKVRLPDAEIQKRLENL